MRKLKQWVKWLPQSHTASKGQCPYSLQCYSHQSSMVLAQKQTHRSVEQNRKPRNKPRLLWSINLWQRRQEYTIEKRQSLQFSLSGWKIFWNHTFGLSLEKSRCFHQGRFLNQLKSWFLARRYLLSSLVLIFPCCCCSVTKSYPTLCDPMGCSMPGPLVLHYLPEFAEIHVHWVGDTMEPSNPLLPPSPFAFYLS